LRRALSSSPKVVVGSDQWSIDVQGMYVRFVRSDEATLVLGTMALVRSLSSSAWQVTEGHYQGTKLAFSRPLIWQFGPNGPALFDGCQTVSSTRRTTAGWVRTNTIQWRHLEALPENPFVPAEWTPKSGCPDQVKELSARLRSIVTSDFIFARSGSTATVTVDGSELRLTAIDRSRIESAFRQPPERRGTWTLVSLVVGGRAVAPPQRLNVTAPAGGWFLSDGCNNYRTGSIELDGKLYGSIAPLTTLPCTKAAPFAAIFRALVVEADVHRDVDTVTLSNETSTATFTFTPAPVTSTPTVNSGRVLSGSWRLADLSVEGRRLPTQFGRKDAGLVSITFRGAKADYFDGCNSHTDASYDVTGNQLQLNGGASTAAGCFGEQADNSATATAAAISGNLTIKTTSLVFQRGDAVAIFRKTSSAKL
jgi:heat shock protein HslJ